MTDPLVSESSGECQLKESLTSSGTNESSATLDPGDWSSFRTLAHAALDDCIDFVASVRERPVWQSVPGEVLEDLRGPVPYQPTALQTLVEEVRDKIMPYATGNVHPRFFGWVHGAGTVAGILAELMAATMNSNCGGREHAAIYVERQIIEWCREIFGLPAGGSGVLTVGTSMAAVIAVAAARVRKLGAAVRADGHTGTGSRLVGYSSAEAHVSLRKAFELVGIGNAQLRAIPTLPDYSMSMERLAAAIRADRAAGLEPFLIIGTAGTVNTGAFDRLDAIADLARHECLWFHVDGAFGAWAKIAGHPWHDLVRGIERADSLAFDFHKWISVPYDAGCVLIRDEHSHRAAFAERPNYLAAGARGLAAGDPWPCDYGIDLSRGFRALKVWVTLRHYGIAQLGAMIAKNCRSAAHLGKLIEESELFELAAPVSLNICCFCLKGTRAIEPGDAVIARLVEEIQLSGIAAPSTTRIGTRLCVRVAILNHRSTDNDLEMLFKSACEILRGLT
jgi:glutamate/tyrosine decarboxylase-like PLP-dependent enzyme